MTDSRVEVLPVVEGSIIWLHNLHVDDPADRGGTMLDGIMSQLIGAVGHDRFVVLCTEGEGVVDVLGPEDLVARVRAALNPGEPDAHQ